MKFAEFTEIIRRHGFELQRQGRGSHAIWRGTVKGQVRQVVVAGIGADDVKHGTLASMIRQSGLPKRLFGT
jgi:predicted RNA binding protein YcfA (HicA-like mRNA interferase family)